MVTSWTQSAEELLAGAVADGTLPGAVVVATGPDADAREIAAGTLRVGEDEPVRADTMFRLMSMTKAFASVAALQLVEQGRLSLDQEVAEVMPAFRDLKVLDGFDGDTPRLREPSRQATITHLMTHTAGHGYPFLNADLLRYHQVTEAPDMFSGLRAALQAPLVADPGTEWNYGINTDWLGQVVETVSGQDLASYLREHLFTPLDMTDATFSPSDQQRGRLMAIHSRTPDGGLTVTELEAPLPAPDFWPAGHGCYGTARDYARFMAALLGDGELDGARILRPETVAMAFSDHLSPITVPEVMTSTIPELANSVVSAPFSQTWGLGFHLFTEDLPGMRRAGAGDWAGLFNCFFWIDRASGVASAFLTQVLPFFDERIVGTAVGIEQAIYAAVGAPA